MTDFTALGLDPRRVAVIARTGLTVPTPIQAQAIPEVLAGRDVLGLAQTGTGKTAAFGLPLIDLLAADDRRPQPRRVRALILAPTRELVNQIAAALEIFRAGTGLRVVTVMGGASLNRQTAALARGTDILVATPGRLIDLLERGAMALDHTGFLVLDEADQMLDIGFIHALRRIVRLLPAKRQTMLFSATMPKAMDELAAAYLDNPVRVAVNPPGQVADRIDQAVHFINQGDKARLLEEYLRGHEGEAALVFCRTKHGADKLAKLLDGWGFIAGAIHGNRSQNQRERVLASFRAGEISVMVATDVAARGLDIPLVRHVYNYDLPNVAENYVHRIGRTARAGAAGRAVAFCAPGEIDELAAVEKTLKAVLPVIGGTRPAAGF
ncbi:MAG: DEAD/DEAH box helicase, partial [Rhodobacteraceae bacterium]|nr:DEAD/DEAH box helicase [Paracoccaceae bacterium]